jgi:hypothetical protein
LKLPEFSFEVGHVFCEEFLEDRQRFLKLIHTLLSRGERVTVSPVFFFVLTRANPQESTTV